MNIRVILCLAWLCCVLGGCDSAPKPKPTVIANVTPAETALGALVDLQRELSDTKATLKETLDAKLKLDESRAAIEKDLKSAQSQITQQEADAENGRAIARQQAAMERKIQYAMAGFGAMVILAGGVLLWFTGFTGWKGTAILGTVGMFIIVVAFKLPELGNDLKWATRIAGIIGGLTGTAWIGKGLWTKWRTDTQAARQRIEAERKMLMAQAAYARGETLEAQRLTAEAAALFASAQQLEHIDAPGYDATRVDPSAKAVKLLTPGTEGP